MTHTFPCILAVLALAAGCRGVRHAPVPSDDPTLAVLGASDIACGAVAVAPDLAVTASHCVPETVVHFLMAADSGRPSRARRGFVVARDASSDLAVFSSSELVPAELGDDSPLRSTASMIAHVPIPWGVVAVHPHDVEDGFVRTERLRVGASGSGLWNSDWQLVGVAIGNDNRAGYFASTSRVLGLLRSVPRDARGRVVAGDTRECAVVEERGPTNARKRRPGPGAEDVRKLLDKASERRGRIDTKLTELGQALGSETR